MINVRAITVVANAHRVLLAALLLAACATPVGAFAVRSGAQPSLLARTGVAGGCPQQVAARYGIVARQRSASAGGSTIDAYGVAAITAHDVWIGGEALATHALSGTSAFSGTVSLIEHWDGRRWCVADSPPLAYGVLRSLAASGPADVWAVGDGGSSYENRPLIEHWDGRRWTLARAQAIPGAHLYNLTSVAASSPSDVWVVGYADPLGRSSSEQQVVEHWDGHAWRLVPTGIAPQLQGFYRIDAVTTRAANDTWIVGQDSTQDQGPFTMHWDGKQWQQVPLPLPASVVRREMLDAVVALSARDVWAVGLFNDYGIGGTGPLAFHWNGVRWREVPVPNDPQAAHSPGLQGWELHAIAAVSPVDIWAMNEALHALHWNGRVWHVIVPPGPQRYSVQVSAVSAVSTRDVWAVGPYFLTADHWNGHRWETVSLAPAG